jgi:predicted CoA-substrate-specific enzyme activase
MDKTRLLPLTDVLAKAEGRIGIDVGSRSIKACSMVDGIISLAIANTTETLFAGIGPIPEGAEIVATGYGRGKVPGARTIPEIRAHAVGALNSIDLDTFTLLDIGGQDFKVVRIEKKGIRDFTMNDKCAAGTGRFLEKMAQMLDMGLDDLGSFKGRRKVLESTCSVFTETELISLMMEGATKEELASGVIYSVYERIRPYLRMYPRDHLILTGGVANMDGVRCTLKDQLRIDVVVPDHAQFMGAMGCFLVKPTKTS